MSSAFTHRSLDRWVSWMILVVSLSLSRSTDNAACHWTSISLSIESDLDSEEGQTASHTLRQRHGMTSVSQVTPVHPLPHSLCPWQFLLNSFVLTIYLDFCILTSLFCLCKFCVTLFRLSNLLRDVGRALQLGRIILRHCLKFGHTHTGAQQRLLPVSKRDFAGNWPD